MVFRCGALRQGTRRQRRCASLRAERAPGVGSDIIRDISTACVGGTHGRDTANATLATAARVRHSSVGALGAAGKAITTIIINIIGIIACSGVREPLW